MLEKSLQLTNSEQAGPCWLETSGDNEDKSKLVYMKDAEAHLQRKYD